ncbi:MAG TPA: hypothetical protein VK188_08725 [Holophaga sp.]|nr:hypothetical protein [Holophaga sp.]
MHRPTLLLAAAAVAAPLAAQAHLLAAKDRTFAYATSGGSSLSIRHDGAMLSLAGKDDCWLEYHLGLNADGHFLTTGAASAPQGMPQPTDFSAEFKHLPARSSLAHPKLAAWVQAIPSLNGEVAALLAKLSAAYRTSTDDAEKYVAGGWHLFLVDMIPAAKSGQAAAAATVSTSSAVSHATTASGQDENKDASKTSETQPSPPGGPTSKGH